MQVVPDIFDYHRSARGVRADHIVFQVILSLQAFGLAF